LRIVLGVALLHTAVVAWTAPCEVFYACDGGYKLLLVKERMREGARPDLHVPAPTWAEPLYRDGLFPLGLPFVYRVGDQFYPGSPPWFQTATAPFVRWLGPRGLFVLPGLGACVTWLATILLASRLGLGPRGQALCLLLTSLAAPLVLYGGTFWEHTLATALLTLSLALLLGGGVTSALGAGVLAGLAVLMRPESGPMFALVLAVSAVRPQQALPRRLLVAGGVGFALIMIPLGVHNMAVAGNLLGRHAWQLKTRLGTGTVLERAGTLLKLLIAYSPAFVFVPLAVRRHPSAPPASKDPHHSLRRLWVLAAVAFVVFSAPMFPNAGGKQWGPRYLFVSLPLLAIGVVEAARSWRGNRVLEGLIAAATLAGVILNAGVGTADLVHDRRDRVLPALRYLEAQPQQVVAVSHQWAAMELAALADSRVLVALRGVATADRPLKDDWDPRPSESPTDLLGRTLLARGIDSYLMVTLAEQHMPAERRDAHVVTRFEPMGLRGIYNLFTAHVAPL
jgi:hypothetical protein